MKTSEIVKLIKDEYLEFEDDSIYIHLKHENLVLELNWSASGGLEYDLWNDKTEEDLYFTEFEYRDLEEFFEKGLEREYREHESWLNQRDHEDYLWDNR